MAYCLVMALPGNTACFDCGEACSRDPWVSANHGTVICIHCAGRHRALGAHLSVVRSLNLDNLKEPHLQLLMQGGNARFREWLEEPETNVRWPVWQALSVKERYNTPAADLYRRRLRAMVDGLEELPTDLQRVPTPVRSSCSSSRAARGDASRPPLGAAAASSPQAAAHHTAAGLAVGQRPAGKPVWTRDCDAEVCELCKQAFTFLYRRHHCRKCGRCICAECSPQECMRPLPQLSYGSTPQRQCKACQPPCARSIEGLRAVH